MLRAMILIVLVAAILIVIVTQVILPMVVADLKLFWMFKKGSRDDLTVKQTEDTTYIDLDEKAQEAKQGYKNVKNIIKTQKKKLDKIDRDSEL